MSREKRNTITPGHPGSLSRRGLFKGIAATAIAGTAMLGAKVRAGQGDVTGSRAAGGDVTGGDVTGGKTTGGEASGGEASGGKVAGGEVTGGKVNKDIAYYRDYPDIENYARCGRCEHYVEGGYCRVVEGPVSDWGVCNLFRRRYHAQGYGRRY